MVIVRKPQSKNVVPQNTNVDALINKGGTVAEDIKKKAVEKQVVLRIPFTMLATLDALLQERMIHTPRHTWILEAVAEKLERENTPQTT